MNDSKYADMILVHALPDVALESYGEVCYEWDPFELTGGMPEGGEYTGPGVMDGMFDPEVAGIGAHMITYTYTDEFDCENFAEAEIIVTSCVGLNELDGSALQIYPNPSTGSYNLVTGYDKPVELEIFNSGGQKILNAVIEGSGKVDLSGKPNGIYYLRVKDEMQQIIRLVLMQN